MFRTKSLICIALLLALLGSIGYAQEPKPLDATLVSLNPQNFPFVYMNVAVNSFGQGISDLTQSNFEVYENGTLQTDYFEVTPPQAGAGSRLTDIIFLMDNSGSMGDEINAVSNNVIDFVDNLSTAGIDFALGLCRFGSTENSGYPIIEDNGNLTQDANYFKNDVWARNIISGGFEPGWDALYKAATDFNFRPGAQKVFILITDETPTDNNNVGNYTQQEAISILQSNSITTFALIDLNDAHAVSDYGTIAEQTNGQYFDIYNPFDDIFDYISSGIANTYLIRYRSSDPNFNGVLRNVQVVVTYQGYQATAEGSYTPGSAPQVQRTQATLDLHNQAWAAGTEFTIEAEITDNMTPYVQSATLYYKNTSEPESAYHFIGTTNTFGNLWEGVIPGGDVQTPGLDYYLTATDGQSTVSDPSVGPAKNSYQLAILPNQAPQITHTLVTTATVETTIPITAEIVDNTNWLSSVELFYRKTGQLLYQAVAMTNTSGDNYQAEIPANYVTIDGVDYYIFAKDDLGVGNYHGTPDNPHSISITTHELSLLEKYAPVLYFYRKDENIKEEIYPWGVYSMLDYSDLKRGLLKYKEKSKPRLEDLEKTKYDTVKHYLDLYDVGPWDVPDKPAEKDRWNDYDYWVYGRYYEPPPPHDDKIILQYWFFYPYNDWYNNHEGDWEMIQITLGKAPEEPKAEKICYSHHRSGNWDNWSRVDLFQGTHPKIFITKGAHGSWITPGNHEDNEAIGVDETSDTGMVLYPHDYIFYDMTANDPSDPSWPIWAHWKGRWGEGIFAGFKGPDSPANIKYSNETQQKPRWEDPIGWSEQLEQGEKPSYSQYGANAQSTPVMLIELHAYDQYGNHVGLTGNPGIETTIPGTYFYMPSTYSDDQKERMWIYTSEDIRFEIEAGSEGKFDFMFNRYLKEQDLDVTVTYQDVSFTENTIASVDVSPENPEYLMEIDFDGDGTVDEVKKPDIIEGAPTTGSISGEIFYSGTQTGDIWITIFDQFPWSGPPVADTNISTPAPYSITGLPEGTYYVVAQMLIAGGDMSPTGIYGPSYGPPDPVIVTAGQNTPNIDITLKDPGSISGTISYAGTQTGKIYMRGFIDSSLTGPCSPPVLVSNEPGPYSLVAPSLTLYITAFIDCNENGECDDTDPSGKYGAPDPVTVEPGVDTPNIDITLVDPTVPPTGTIVINGGATYTNSRNVTLTLDAEDAATMCFSNNNPTWSAWEAYATTKSWSLSSGDGQKTVYVKFKDASGVESDTYSDTIVLDTTAPTGSISINKGAAYTDSKSVTLTLSAIGAATMCFSNDNSTWSSWESYATSKSWTLVSGDGTKRVYARFKDAAGNVSETYSDTIIYDTTPPNVAIISPKSNTYVGGTLNIIGSATDTHFRGYKLHYGQGESPSSWNLIKESDSTVDNSTLGSWDTTKVTDGTYTLKLWADDKANNSAETKVKIFIDNTPPEIENLGLDQENFIPGDYASSTPTILATLTDTGSGIDETTIDLRIKPAEGDEIVVPASSVSFNSETDEMSYTVTESLADSEYTVSLNVKDKVGNSAEEKTTEFVIESELAIKKVLNYPNPFSSDTKFTYYLTRDVDEVTIKVYTVAGELVKTIDFASSHVGYNEEEWDGINDYGEELANGTYVYKITVKFGDEKVSKVQMLTVLK